MKIKAICYFILPVLGLGLSMGCGHDTTSESTATPKKLEPEVDPTNARYGICRNPTLTGVKLTWRNRITDAYLRNDLLAVKSIMQEGANAYGLAGHGNAGKFLTNFLEKKGDIKIHYTGQHLLLDKSAWISQAPATKAAVESLSLKAAAQSLEQIANGKLSGSVVESAWVVTDGDRDGDLYYSMGKFKLTLNAQFSADAYGENPRIERTFVATDRYDWDPPRRCGILDHIIPKTLVDVGLAADFNVEISWKDKAL
jgi:hypothetical protein